MDKKLHTVQISPTYYTGEDCLRLAVPWLTPGAVCWLNTRLNRNMSVLEFGSGGSTLFFTLRCKQVLSIESDPDWFQSVKDCVSPAQAERLRLILAERSGTWYSHEPEEVFGVTGKQRFDVILVDPAGIDRNKVLKTCCHKLNAGGMLVLDNYSVLFPDSLTGKTRWGSNESFFEPGFACHLRQGWKLHCFDDPYWGGSGTAVLIRPTDKSSKILQAQTGNESQ